MSLADNRFGKRVEAHNIRNIAAILYAIALVATAAASLASPLST